MRRTITKLTEWLFELKFFSFHYWRAPRGPKGVKKSLFFYKWNCFLFALRKTQTSKAIKIEAKCQKKNCFPRLFWIFFNFGTILVRIFWHPWDTWGRVNSGDARVLRFVLIILWWWHRLADFSLFHLYENVAQCQLYNQGH